MKNRGPRYRDKDIRRISTVIRTGAEVLTGKRHALNRCAAGSAQPPLMYQATMLASAMPTMSFGIERRVSDEDVPAGTSRFP
jgi:hypothetical protein